MSICPSDRIRNTLDRIFSQVDGCRRVGEDGDRWMCCCPAHDDGTPSLSIKLADDGKILLHCFTGCRNDAIVRALGLQWRDLFPEDRPASTIEIAPSNAAANAAAGTNTNQPLGGPGDCRESDLEDLEQLAIVTIGMPEHERAADREIRRRLYERPRGKRCGVVVSGVRTGSGKGFSCLCRCRRNTGCQMCRGLNRYLWLRHLKEVLHRENTPETLFWWAGPLQESAKLLARCRKRGGQYCRVELQEGNCLLIATVNFGTGILKLPGQKITPQGALNMLLEWTREIPETAKRPITTSRAWALSRKKEEKEKEPEGLLVRLRTQDQELLRKVVGAAGAKVGDLEPDSYESSTSSFWFKLPEPLRNEKAVAALQRWLDAKAVPPNGNLFAEPPQREIILGFPHSTQDKIDLSEFDAGWEEYLRRNPPAAG